MLKKSAVYMALIALVVMACLPFVWLLSTALKGSEENIFAYPPQFIPHHPTLNNFYQVWQKLPMLQFFINSLVVTIATIALNLIFSIMAAYPLARMRFRGENIAFFSILATMMIPFQVLMIPLYLICLRWNLTDAAGLIPGWLGLILPFALSGFGIFFVRQAMVTLPKELEESAVLDGCNSWQILWLILLPLIRPTLATLAIFTFMASWGEFLWPSIILSEPTHFTLPLGLIQLQSAFSSDWRLIAAGTLLSMVPILIFFFSLQRYFIAGSTSGAVKG